MTLSELKQLKDRYEFDGGRQAMGVRLTAAQAADLRWELYQIYGNDPGQSLMTLYGLAVLSTDAPSLQFEI
ncbi:MAG: hypothetical protein HQL60_01195 [Magnetococcales bacterium]|nr:hypothetical protein [Magnetococcales bacterium]